MRRHRRRLPVVVAAVAALAAIGAGEATSVRVDNWDAYPPAPLDLSGAWRRYPSESRPFKQPPAIAFDDGRPVLHLATAGEAMRVGRAVTVDLRRAPWLTWEWKPLALPEGGDVRDRKRNDQVGRVMVVFEGMRGIAYVWDTTAPVGTEVEPDGFEIFQRALIVVRSGPDGLGRWHRERRNVASDHRRIWDEAPRPVKLVTLESHSNDTDTRTAVRFGSVRFEPR